MNTVRVRNIEIGAGIPKICVPIVGKTREEILRSAEEIRSTSADLVEWRADWYEDIFDFGKTEKTLSDLRDALGEIPLLFTFRTADEGGEKSIETETYVKLNQKAAESGLTDLVDVEMFRGGEAVRTVLGSAHTHGVKVIMSNHDFCGTPEQEEIILRLRKMQEMGADILKIAVMPGSREDVLTLLSATEKMTRLYAERPVITMSMAGSGVISRICGEVFGSAVTFGAVGKTSAPGQMDAEDLAVVLRLLHGSM